MLYDAFQFYNYKSNVSFEFIYLQTPYFGSQRVRSSPYTAPQIHRRSLEQNYDVRKICTKRSASISSYDNRELKRKCAGILDNKRNIQSSNDYNTQNRSRDDSFDTCSSNDRKVVNARDADSADTRIFADNKDRNLMSSNNFDLRNKIGKKSQTGVKRKDIYYYQGSASEIDKQSLKYKEGVELRRHREHRSTSSKSEQRRQSGHDKRVHMKESRANSSCSDSSISVSNSKNRAGSSYKGKLRSVVNVECNQYESPIWRKCKDSISSEGDSDVLSVARKKSKLKKKKKKKKGKKSCKPKKEHKIRFDSTDSELSDDAEFGHIAKLESKYRSKKENCSKNLHNEKERLADTTTDKDMRRIVIESDPDEDTISCRNKYIVNRSLQRKVTVEILRKGTIIIDMPHQAKDINLSQDQSLTSSLPKSEELESHVLESKLLQKKGEMEVIAHALELSRRNTRRKLRRDSVRSDSKSFEQCVNTSNNVQPKLPVISATEDISLKPVEQKKPYLSPDKKLQNEDSDETDNVEECVDIDILPEEEDFFSDNDVAKGDKSITDLEESEESNDHMRHNWRFSSEDKANEADKLKYMDKEKLSCSNEKPYTISIINETEEVHPNLKNFLEKHNLREKIKASQKHLEKQQDKLRKIADDRFHSGHRLSGRNKDIGKTGKTTSKDNAKYNPLDNVEPTKYVEMIPSVYNTTSKDKNMSGIKMHSDPIYEHDNSPRVIQSVENKVDKSSRISRRLGAKYAENENVRYNKIETENQFNSSHRLDDRNKDIDKTDKTGKKTSKDNGKYHPFDKVEPSKSVEMIPSVYNTTSKDKNMSGIKMHSDPIYEHDNSPRVIQSVENKVDKTSRVSRRVGGKYVENVRYNKIETENQFHSSHRLTDRNKNIDKPDKTGKTTSKDNAKYHPLDKVEPTKSVETLPFVYNTTSKEKHMSGIKMHHDPIYEHDISPRVVQSLNNEVAKSYRISRVGAKYAENDNIRYNKIETKNIRCSTWGVKHDRSISLNLDAIKGESIYDNGAIMECGSDQSNDKIRKHQFMEHDYQELSGKHHSTVTTNESFNEQPKQFSIIGDQQFNQSIQNRDALHTSKSNQRCYNVKHVQHVPLDTYVDAERAISMNEDHSSCDQKDISSFSGKMGDVGDILCRYDSMQQPINEMHQKNMRDHLKIQQMMRSRENVSHHKLNIMMDKSIEEQVLYKNLPKRLQEMPSNTLGSRSAFSMHGHAEFVNRERGHYEDISDIARQPTTIQFMKGNVQAHLSNTLEPYNYPESRLMNYIGGISIHTGDKITHLDHERNSGASQEFDERIFTRFQGNERLCSDIVLNRCRTADLVPRCFEPNEDSHGRCIKRGIQSSTYTITSSDTKNAVTTDELPRDYRTDDTLRNVYKGDNSSPSKYRDHERLLPGNRGNGKSNGNSNNANDISVCNKGTESGRSSKRHMHAYQSKDRSSRVELNMIKEDPIRTHPRSSHHDDMNKIGGNVDPCGQSKYSYKSEYIGLGQIEELNIDKQISTTSTTIKERDHYRQEYGKNRVQKYSTNYAKDSSDRYGSHHDTESRRYRSDTKHDSSQRRY